MSLLSEFTREEQIACIAFLKMVARSDDIMKEEEIAIIHLLSNNLKVNDQDIIKLGETKIKLLLRSMTKSKTLELLRMGYTILDIDDQIHLNEIKIMDYLASSHNIKIVRGDFLDTILIGSPELTALDKVVLASLIYQMMFADSKIHTNELNFFEKFLNQNGMNKNEVKGLVIPIPILVKAVKTMSKPSVNKIIEQLVTIAMIDNEFSRDEFEILFPILSESDIDLHTIIDRVNAKKEGK
jgi:uncharacterized tellurite resistance protein B-like protein